MKDLPFLTHDIGARNDPKLLELQMEMGGKGLGLFWCLVEMLWENGGFIPANYKSIAFSLRWCKPSEVEKVVNNFDLFQVEDGLITSKSACERIKVKREKSEALSQSRANAANARWKQGQNKDDANAMQMQCNSNANAKQTDASIDISIYQSINNKLINNNIPPTAEFLFEIFFFRNLKDPSGEVARFLKHYGEKEKPWTYQDGTPITDAEQAARDWKPAKAGTRFDQEALNWYKAIYNAARGIQASVFDTFLGSLTTIRRKDNKLDLVFATQTAARAVASFIQDNDLAGDYIIDYRVCN